MKTTTSAQTLEKAISQAAYRLKFARDFAAATKGKEKVEANLSVEAAALTMNVLLGAGRVSAPVQRSAQTGRAVKAPRAKKVARMKAPKAKKAKKSRSAAMMRAWETRRANAFAALRAKARKVKVKSAKPRATKKSESIPTPSA